MNFTIWRTVGDEFLMAGASMVDGYISISGIWGIKTKQIRKGEHAVFEDEANGDYYYMTDKGKNWKKMVALCPELKQFEFWDENIARVGTLDQEQCIHYAGMKDAPFNEKMLELDKAGLREVDVDAERKRGTIFPPHYTAQSYLYGTCILKLPAPDAIQVAFNNMAKEEAQ
jgi:hypothetical protein